MENRQSVMLMGRAQDRLDAMLKEHVAPELRRLGFKGSGQAYSLPDEQCYASLGFQKGKWNSAESASFRVNVSVVNRLVWQEWERPRPAKPPSPNTSYGEPVWWQRIGRFLPGDGDVWWTVSDDTNVEGLANEVVRAISDAALPAMVAEMERQRHLTPDV